MIPAMYSIGKYASSNAEHDMLSGLVDNPNSNGQYDIVLIIVFEERDGVIRYKDIKVEEFSNSKLTKYAYKKGPPRGFDLTPTSKVVDVEKTYSRIKSSLKNISESINGVKQEEKTIIEINNILQDEDISTEILKKLNGIEIENRAVLTIGVEDENGLKYVGDIDLFVNAFKEEYEQNFYYKKSYKKKERTSIGTNNVCYLCGNKSEKTYGFVSTYAFYSLDKPGFTSGGFNRANAWKNYPICPDCAYILDQGKKYVEKNLSASFYGIDYILVPETIMEPVDETSEEMFELLESLEEKKKLSLSDTTRTTIIEAEEDLVSFVRRQAI